MNFIKTSQFSHTKQILRISISSSRLQLDTLVQGKRRCTQNILLHQKIDIKSHRTMVAARERASMQVILHINHRL